MKFFTMSDKQDRIREYNHEYYLKHRFLTPKAECPKCHKVLAVTLLEKHQKTKVCKRFTKVVEKKTSKYTPEILQNIVTDMFQDMYYTSCVILDNAKPNLSI
jgi:hypothetical protein